MKDVLNRMEFISVLTKELKNIDADELEEVIKYYNEYFDDAEELGEENLAQAIKELGSPQKIACEIRQTTAAKDLLDDETKNSDFKNVILIILGIFSLPITFPLAIVFFCFIFVGFIFVASILFTGFVTAGAFLFSCVIALICSVYAIAINPLASLMTFGVALSIGALGVIIFILTLSFTNYSMKSFGSGVNNLINKKRGK